MKLLYAKKRKFALVQQPLPLHLCIRSWLIGSYQSLSKNPEKTKEFYQYPDKKNRKSDISQLLLKLIEIIKDRILKENNPIKKPKKKSNPVYAARRW